jgi:hypothetical protein
LAARTAPAALLSYQTTRAGRLRGDFTYTYRSLKHYGRWLVRAAAQCGAAWCGGARLADVVRRGAAGRG